MNRNTSPATMNRTRQMPMIVLGSIRFSFLPIPGIKNTGSELSHLPAYVIAAFISEVIVVKLDGKN
jgi:uncharacterized membrane protein